MKHPESLILYVDHVDTSAQFFHALFGAPVVEQSVNFAMLILPGGLGLGLWLRADVKPEPIPGAAGTELVVTTASEAETEAAWAEVGRRGLVVVQQPVRLDFGYTFVVSSPDGHRIRVFNP
jgi:catechol 2,3-dioxygenase-like lactoylglutathione lyase family enzyme